MPLNKEVTGMALWPQGLCNTTMTQRLVTSGRLQPRPRRTYIPDAGPRSAYVPRLYHPASSHENLTL